MNNISLVNLSAYLERKAMERIYITRIYGEILRKGDSYKPRDIFLFDTLLLLFYDLLKWK